MRREGNYEPDEIRRARAVIWINLACVAAWVLINCAAGWWLHNARPFGVAAAGLGMAAVWTWALRDISKGHMAGAVAAYTVSGLLLLLVMGLFIPELSLLFTFATFIFLAFGLSYMSGRASMRVVALTIAVALVLLVTSVGLRWTSGVPDSIYRWVNLTGMLMALSIDATMFVMLRRTLEARAGRLVEAERAAAEMQRRLGQQERLESLGQLAGGVAHDFNNLLGVIMSFANFAREQVAAVVATRDPGAISTAETDLLRVTEAAERAARLTRQLLTFAQREVVRREVVDMNEVITELEPLLRRSLGEHIEFVFRPPSVVWPVVIDKGHLEQIVVNLAVNARDAMPDGGNLSIEIENIEIEASRAALQPSGIAAGRYVRLRVTDSGKGMDKQTLAHAFEPFFTTKPRGAGSGLGLATVHGLVTQAGGTVQLKSEPGYGSTLTALFPATDQAIVAAVDSDRRPDVGGSERVLVVEDRDDLRELTVRMLTRNGYAVVSASNGPDAIELVRDGGGQIDVLVTDVVMPKMLGPEVAARFAAMIPDLAVLFMSGYAQPILGAQGTLEPGMDLLDKPFTEAKLLAKLREVLERRAAATATASRPRKVERVPDEAGGGGSRS
jgi:signal transduction histidine kinase/CheY-like chemotaxis protein